MDFNKTPKLLADAWHLNHNKAWFFLGFTSGSEGSAFLLPPPGAKTLYLELGKRIKKYEEEFGAIDIQGVDTKIQSPIQMQ